MNAAGRQRTYIIAEAGVNHNGSLNTALSLVEAAREAGADAVKFQTFKAESMVSAFAPKARYQEETTGGTEGQLEMLRRLELDREAHYALMSRCAVLGIEFLSTAFDLDSLGLLESLGVSTHKVASGEITNLPLLEAIGATRKPVIISSGMCEIEEVIAALTVLRKAGAGECVALHCNTEYPTPFEDVNLRAMCAMGEQLGCPVGYSDHTVGITIPVAAVALGATVIEKHFTLDRRMPGPDHRASLEPDELSAMVRSIREVEAALGDGVKRPTSSEIGNRVIARKSIVAAKRICKGEKLTLENLGVKRPGTGLSPMLWHEILGTAALRDYERDEPIER